jgi:hypothetical protein
MMVLKQENHHSRPLVGVNEWLRGVSTNPRLDQTPGDFLDKINIKVRLVLRDCVIEKSHMVFADTGESRLLRKE